MNKQEKIQYWIKSAEKDWMVAGHLFEKEDYPYALFFGHLTIEKLLKAIFVSKVDEPPPFTHRLTYLAEKNRHCHISGENGIIGDNYGFQS